MIIIGVDPGIRNPGIAKVDLAAQRPVVQHAESLSLTDTHDDRLALVCTFFGWNLKDVSLIAIEDQTRVIVGTTRDKVTNAAALPNLTVQGIAIGIAHAGGIPWVLVQPQAAKMAVGAGRKATKAQMRSAVQRVTGWNGANQHVVDAVAIAVAGASQFRRMGLRGTG